MVIIMLLYKNDIELASCTMQVDHYKSVSGQLRLHIMVMIDHGKIRLFGGPNEFEGRVKVCIGGVWRR